MRDDRRERAVVVQEHDGAAPGEASSKLGQALERRREVPPRGQDLLGAQLGEVVHDDVGPAPFEGLAVGPAIDPDHQPETPGAPRLDPGERVLDDGRARWRDVEPGRRLQEEIRIRLALEAEGLDVVAVEPRVEDVPEAGQRDDLATVLAGRDERGARAQGAHLSHALHGAPEDLDAVRVEPLREVGVLAIAQPDHGGGLRPVLGAALGKLDAA